MIQEFKKIWKPYTIGMLWLLGLLWPLLGIHPDGTLSFAKTFTVWLYIFAGTAICLALYLMNKSGSLGVISSPLDGVRQNLGRTTSKVPAWVWIVVLLVFALAYPQFTNRYAQDVATNVLIYICLGLGLNIVIGLAGMLDLGYIAFYGVGAYTYALLNLHYGMSFWVCLPFAAFLAMIAGCIIGYPTLRMRGDYLAIVTLGFGEIIRLILENWNEFSFGPSGIANIPRPGFFGVDMSLEAATVYIYFLMIGLVIFTVFVVNRLQNSRIGRAWIALREDEIACQAMGIDKTRTKLTAFALGATWAGMVGVIFAAKTTFINPASFTFLESAIILSIVVLGGMGSIIGVIIGAFILILLPEYLRAFSDFRMLMFGAIMVIMMVFRPGGLIQMPRRTYKFKSESPGDTSHQVATEGGQADFARS